MRKAIELVKKAKAAIEAKVIDIATKEPGNELVLVIGIIIVGLVLIALFKSTIGNTMQGALKSVSDQITQLFKDIS